MRWDAVSTLFLIASLLFTTYESVDAQSTKKMYRLGALVPGASLSRADEAFRERLRTLGYVEGHNIVIDWRRAADRRTNFFAASISDQDAPQR